MTSEKIGTASKKNIRTRVWWIKLGFSLILSSIFFFVLFAGDSTPNSTAPSLPSGWVEVQLEAQLLTPFQNGKKVLIVHRPGRKKLEGVLKETGDGGEGKITVLVKEEEAHKLFFHETWEVLPYLKNLTFAVSQKGENHEIRY